jgi:hypothetical protein
MAPFSAIVAVTTTASVRDPRAMVKVPAMGKRSMETVSLRILFSFF